MDWGLVATIIGIVASIWGGLMVFVKKILPFARRTGRLLDRLTGVPADPRTGQPEVLGIFERLDHQDGVLETIRHEVEFNNGTSVKDAVTRVEKVLTDHLNITPPTTTINITGGTP